MPSGENEVVLNQAELLGSQGYDVEVWGPTTPANMSIFDKIDTGLRVSVGMGQDPYSITKRFRPNLIHVHNFFPNISLRWLARLDVPAVMSLHNYRSVCANGVLFRDSRPCTDCLTGTSLNAVRHGCYQDSKLATLPLIGFQRRLRSVIAEDLDKIIYTSELSKEVLSPHVANQTSVLIPNYVKDTQQNRSSDHSEPHPYYVILGRLSPEKGIKELLQIWPKGLKLIILGDGPQRDELQVVADPMAVDFRGYVCAAERDRILSQAQALILPSVTLEADPVVVAQALSSGTPCVVRIQTASARLAIRSLAVCTYNDAESLMVALRSVEGSAVRAAARKTFEQIWSANAWMRSYENEVLSSIPY